MDIFNRFKKAVKIREVLVDNEVFQLHYRITALLLLGCSALVASKQHFGDPIDCITRDDVPNKIMDTYCWIHATFTLPAACNKTVGIEVAHPCVDKFVHDREERVYHKYYQWVYFVLFFQATCFYAPHFLWKMWESKLLSTLTNNLRNPLFKLQEQRGEVLLIIYLVDEFLGGTFTTYGLDVLNYVQMNQDDRVDPMVRVFPRMTKCSFHRFGSSGDVQKYDALCILPLNIINEKIYIVMWFWFVFLAIVTGLWLIYRLMTLSRPKIRYQLLRRRANLVNGKHIHYVLSHLGTGDWFLLSMMCKNIDSQWFRFLIIEMKQKFKALEQQKKGRNGNRNNDFLGPYDGKELIINENSDTESGSPDELDEIEESITIGDKNVRPLKEVAVISSDIGAKK